TVLREVARPTTLRNTLCTVQTSGLVLYIPRILMTAATSEDVKERPTRNEVACLVAEAPYTAITPLWTRYRSEAARSTIRTTINDPMNGRARDAIKNRSC